MTNVGEAKFVDGSDGDYCVLAGSRLVDRGEPAAATRLAVIFAVQDGKLASVVAAVEDNLTSVRQLGLQP